MPTVAAKKKAVSRRPSRRAVAAKPSAPAFVVAPRRVPPAVSFTAADLLKRKDFGKGLDGAFVESVVADRAL